MGEISQADRALYQKAIEACCDYRRLYHIYPKNVFISWKRIKMFPFHLMRLSEEPPDPQITECGEMPTESPFKLHEVLFEPIAGKEKDSQWDEDEVYVPLPQNGDTVEVMGSAALVRLLLSMKDQMGEQEA